MAFITYTPIAAKLGDLTYGDGNQLLTAATTNVSLEQLADGVKWLNDFVDGVFTPVHTWSATQTFANGIVISGGNISFTGGATITGTSITFSGGATISSGSRSFTGTQPAMTADPGANTIHGTNVPKMWAYVTTNGSGGSTVQDGFNIASAGLTGAVIRFTFARAMANANYAVSIAADGPGACFGVVSSKNALYVDVSVYNANAPGAVLNPTSNILRVDVVVHGRH